jgi:hypothetical protein
VEAPPASGYPECPGSIGLSITGGPGRPAEPRGKRAVPQAASPAAPFAQRIAPPTAALLLPGITIKPSIHFPIPTPTPTPPPSTAVSVTAPTAGSVWRPGESCPVTWTVNSGRDVTVDLLLSTDGGATWAAVAEGLPNTSPYAVTLPDRTSDACVFRVDAWVGTVLLGYNVSPVFTIAAPLSPTPSPTPSPEPTPALSPSPTDGRPSFLHSDADAFVSSEGDPVRWVRLTPLRSTGKSRPVCSGRCPRSRRLPGRERMSGPPRDCWPPGNWTRASGIRGRLRRPGRRRDTEPPRRREPRRRFSPRLRGGRCRRWRSGRCNVRVVALDASGLPIGRPGSGIPVLYGHGSLDLEISGSLPLPDLGTPGRVSADDLWNGSGFLPGSRGGIRWWCWPGRPSGASALPKFRATRWRSIWQFSTTPFETADERLSGSAGLVWRSDAKGLVYTPVTPVLHPSRSTSSRPPSRISAKTPSGTMCAPVCYLPTDNPSVTYPAVSLTGTVFWTRGSDVR